jgi:surfactin synthase thioesterase subunit
MNNMAAFPSQSISADRGSALFSKDRPLTVYAFAFAGGNTLSYHGWPLPQWIRWVPLDYPGHGLRRKEALLTSLEDYAQDAATCILDDLKQAPGQAAFFGHSMGGVTAWRTAQILRDKISLRHLIVSACSAPDLFPPKGQPIETDADTLVFLEHFHQLPDKVLKNPRFRAHGLPTITHDIRVSNRWVCPKWQPLACPITAFAGTEDTLAPEADMRSWNRFTRSSFYFRAFPGSHFYYEEAAVLADLCAAIADTLDR